ncbi:GlcG/HbpS family heme-binding protein [Ferrovibrio sp.]|uniref:GlcG/HbpS family heme-binding protein n=1 Tax=Ferrovibrio sp. TaxID=1917215 RepID=UPI003D2DCD65
MNLSDAEAAISSAQSAAAAKGLTVSIAVVDAGAYLVAFTRMDGAMLGSIDVAFRKARTAALFRTDSGALGKLAVPGGPIHSIEHSNSGLVLIGGGVVLKDAAGMTIGAIGISGATAVQDEAIAQAAVLPSEYSAA